MRENFDNKLTTVLKKVHEMGVKTFDAVDSSIKGILELDDANEDKIFKLEKEINRMQVDIEREIVAIMATESPLVATDLREMVSAIKIMGSFERIGDYAVHLTKSISKIESLPDSLKDDIKRMKKVLKEMFEALLESYVQKDYSAVKKIASSDKIIDEIHKQFVLNLYDASKKEIDIKSFSKLIFVGRYLERYGDHIKNICECIIYGETNKQVNF